jgi:CheY-like chemotaxis protein
MTHVLIADDEPHTRLTLSLLFGTAGYLVSEAPDGRDAFEKIQAFQESSHPVDLLVVDIEMPGLTGWQLLRELETKEIFLPTVIITGFGEKQPFKGRFQKWRLEFVLKPFTPQRLTDSILNLLRNAGPDVRSS